MAVFRGIGLGLVNVLVTSIVLAIAMREGAAVLLVGLYGAVPGIVAGALIGGLAWLIESWPRRVRAVLLALPAVGVVYWLAAFFGMTELAPLACVPAMASAVMLERVTRKVAPPPIPTAIAHSVVG